MSDEGELDRLTELLEQARGGSGEALGELLDGCRQYLLLTANRRLDPELRRKLGPSDVVQDTLQDAQQDFAYFRGDSEKELLAWLRRILVNNLADTGRRYLRADKRRVTSEVSLSDVLPGLIAGADDSPPCQAMAGERDAALERALAELPDQRRNVIQWRNYERCSFEEIGQRLGRSAGAARKIWVRALDELQRRLEPLDESR